MKHREDTTIVDDLKHILEDYGYLEYDEKTSKGNCLLPIRNGAWVGSSITLPASKGNYVLHIKVTDSNIECEFKMVANDIRRKLRQATGIPFVVAAVNAYNGNWTWFNLHFDINTAVVFALDNNIKFLDEHGNLKYVEDILEGIKEEYKSVINFGGHILNDFLKKVVSAFRQKRRQVLVDVMRVSDYWKNNIRV